MIAVPKSGRVGLAGVLTSSLLIACGGDGRRATSGDAAPSETLQFQRVRGTSQGTTGAGETTTWAAGSWRFGDVPSLRLDVRGPSVLLPGATLDVTAVAEALDGCDVDVRLVEPVLAASQTAFRGRVTARGDRGASAQASATITEGAAALVLAIPSPWRAGAVEIEAEVTCDGARRRAVTGARRELREPGLGRRHDERLAVGVLALAGEPSQVMVPRDDDDDADGVWITSAAPTRTLAEPRGGDALPEANLGGRKPFLTAADTRVGFGWSPRGLMVRALLRDRDLAPVPGGRDTELWKGDAIEIFLAHAEHDRYVELQAAPSGALFDARFVARRQPGAIASGVQGGVAWNGATRVGVTLHGTLDKGDVDEGWDVEVLVPWADLRAVGVIDAEPRVGTTLRANVFRVERSRDGRIAAASLAPTREPDFHAMDEAVKLVLDAGEGVGS